MANLPEWMRDCIGAVDTKLMRQIAEDFRRGPPPPGPTLPTATPIDAGRVVTGTDGAAHTPHRGWQEPPKVDDWRPTGSAGGQAAIDAMMDQQDAIDRAARIRQLAEAGLLLRPREVKKPEEDKERQEKKGG
jgi:hypothetical protein